ncbi:hypothetical protein Q7A36_38640 [Paracraurococcus sp. LOR1-02]|uniref:Uncharacterized protein n=1 Tax=Paracraurococcus lichenis TaxID=3064888 RepID=A0ABT9EDJ9_9PROT|nr:hypothetical protein [Paracraurococcus sp. LOR1-02]MDO9714274.1 hypothetical protein [Paracraurococcus sp. LOR1-02]
MSASRLLASAANWARPGCSWLGAGFTEAGVAPVCRVPQNAPDRAPIPYCLAAACGTVLLQQATADLADAEAVAANPLEDLANHLRLLFDDLIARNSVTVVLANITITVRRSAENDHRSPASSMKFASATSLLDLGAFVLRHHTLNLQEQVVFGRHTDRPVQEHDLHSGAV